MWNVEPCLCQEKVTKAEMKKLNSALDGLSFSCGAPLKDLELDDSLSEVVYVQDLQCGDPVEPLYYAADFEDICVYCCEEVPSASSFAKEYYPQCAQCEEKEKIPRTLNKAKKSN